MAKKGKKSPVEPVDQRSSITDLEPTEFFEIESLNADALDIEELEARLEMAVSIPDLAVYCGADCGVNCVGNCPGNCVANCGGNCAVNCSTNCAIDICGTNEPV